MLLGIILWRCRYTPLATVMCALGRYPGALDQLDAHLTQYLSSVNVSVVCVRDYITLTV